MPFSEHYEEIPMWACEAGCGWEEADCTVAIRVEISTGFLRVTFKCPTCLAQVVRYYDMNARGYVDLTPPRDRGLRCRANCQRYRECTSDCPTLRPANESKGQAVAEFPACSRSGLHQIE
jgi:hypothetical protein